MPGDPSLTQLDFRYRNDDGDESGATWIYARSADGDLEVDTIYRMRICAINDGAGTKQNLAVKWQYNLNAGGWVDITTSSSVVQAVSSAETSWTITNGDDCSQQISTGSYDSTQEGYTEDGTAGGNVWDLFVGQRSETELCFQIVSGDVADNDTIDMRCVEEDGTVFDTYTNSPAISVNEPSGDVTVTLDVLSLTSAPIDLTVVPGATTTSLDVLTLAGAPIDLSVSNPPPPVNVSLDVLSLASAVIDFSVVPGAISVPLDVLDITASPIDLSVVPGEATITLDVLSFAGASIDLTVTSTSTVPLDVLSLVSSPIDLSVIPGSATTLLDVLALAGASIDISVSAPTGDIVNLDVLSLSSSAIDFSVIPGATQIPLDILSLISAGLDLSIIPGEIATSLDVLSASSSLIDLNVIPGECIIPLDVIESSFSPIDLSVSVTGGAQTVSLDTLTTICLMPNLAVAMPAPITPVTTSPIIGAATIAPKWTPMSREKRHELLISLFPEEIEKQNEKDMLEILQLVDIIDKMDND